MTDIVLPPLANMQTATLLNSNMQEVQDAINNDVVHRSGGNNTMNQDLDMNSNNLLNVATDPNDPNSLAKIQDLGNYKAAAAQSATDAANSAADAANLATSAADSATSAANSAASAGSNLGYATKAQMDADLNPPDGTIRIVTNDPIIDNNQTYRKSGASGTGSWVASVDRLANALGNASGFQQAGTGSVTRDFQDKARERLSVLDKGADPTGASASDAAFLAAITDATASGYEIKIPAGTYKFTGSTTLLINLGKFSFVGEGDVVLDFSAFTGSNAIQVFSSQSYPTAARKNTKHRFSGVTMIGAKVSGRHGLLVGHATYTYNGQCNIERVASVGFDRDLHFTHNAWRCSFSYCTFLDALTRHIYAPSGLSNSGEVMDFIHCQIADGLGDVEFACDGWQVEMHGCSILNTSLLITGRGVRCDLFGGNIENPGATGYYDYINITQDASRVTLHGTKLTMDQPALFTESPIKVAANSVFQTFGVSWPDGAFALTTNGATYSFCSGAGVVICHGSAFAPLSGGSKPNIGRPANSLYNGDFETGDLKGWTSAPYGTAGSTAVVGAASAKNGSYGVRLTSTVSGNGINVTKKVSVRTGQMVAAGCWYKVITAAASGTSGVFGIAFFDELGNPLLSAGSNLSNTNWDVGGTSFTRYAPVGAASVQVSLNAQNGGVVDFDDVIINVA